MISNKRKKGDRIHKVIVYFPSATPLTRDTLMNKATNIKFVVGREGLFKVAPDMKSGSDAAKKLAVKLLGL